MADTVLIKWRVDYNGGSAEFGTEANALSYKATVEPASITQVTEVIRGVPEWSEFINEASEALGAILSRVDNPFIISIIGGQFAEQENANLELLFSVWNEKVAGLVQVSEITTLIPQFAFRSLPLTITASGTLEYR